MISLTVFVFFGPINVSGSALTDLQKTFRGKKGFEVRFQQEVVQSTFKDQNNLAEGSVRFSRPNDLKWTYEKPTKRVIEYDGKRLLVTEGTEQQEQKDSGPLNLQESFSFLWGETNQTLYKVEVISADAFQIRPRNPKNTTFKTIDVKVKNGMVVEAKIQNNLEGVSRLRFSNWHLF